MSEFKVGDYVRIIQERSVDFDVIGVIQRIENGRYKVTNSYWYLPDELRAVTKEEYERVYADSLPVLPGSPLDARLPASATAPAAGVVDFSPSEFERGWDSATQSMLSIIERVLENPAGGDRLAHIVELVANMRVDYPKHGVRAAQASEGGD